MFDATKVAVSLAWQRGFRRENQWIWGGRKNNWRDRSVHLWRGKSARFREDFRARNLGLGLEPLTIQSELQWAASGYGKLLFVWDGFCPDVIINWVLVQPWYREWDGSMIRVSLYHPGIVQRSACILYGLWNRWFFFSPQKSMPFLKLRWGCPLVTLGGAVICLWALSVFQC